MPATFRPFTQFWITPPGNAAQPHELFGDAATEKLLWLLLDRPSNSADDGRSMFVGSLAQRNALWRDFSNFVRQGKTYWEAARSTRGSSAALNYYYAFLNLAKAELLRVSPTPNLHSVHHGLRAEHSKSGRFAGENLIVNKGVFSMLYERRTGVALPLGTRLPISRLIRQIPEIGLEAGMAGFGDPFTVPGYHALVTDGAAWWPLLCFAQNVSPWSPATGRDPVIALLETQFERVDRAAIGNWRQVFAVSLRLRPPDIVIYQGRQPHLPATALGSDLADNQLRALLGANVSDPILDPADFHLSLSLFRSRRLDMPAPLARYALMFWLSSVVRYRPSVLDPRDRAEQAWVADSMCAEMPIYLLAAALGGIRHTQVHFEPAGYRT